MHLYTALKSASIMVSDVLPENVSGLPYASCVIERPCSSMHLARCQLTPRVPFQPAPHARY